MEYVQNLIQNVKQTLLNENTKLIEEKIKEEAKLKAVSQNNFESEINNRIKLISNKLNSICNFLELKDEEIANSKSKNLSKSILQNLTTAGFISKEGFEKELNQLPIKFLNNLLQNNENFINIIIDKVKEHISNETKKSLDNFENKIEEQVTQQCQKNETYFNKFLDDKIQKIGISKNQTIQDQFKLIENKIINSLLDHPNFKNFLQKESQNFSSEDTSSILSKSIKTEEKPSSFDIFQLSQKISKVEENIIRNFDGKFSNIERRCTTNENIKENDKNKLRNLEASLNEFVQKVSEIKLELEIQSSFTTNIEEKMNYFEEKMKEINANHLKIFKKFDEQFEKILKSQGKAYSKIINSENIFFDGNNKESKSKITNNSPSYQFNEIIKKELSRISSKLMNLESNITNCSENIDKNHNETQEIKIFQENLANKLQELNKSLEGKTDFILFSQKCDKNDSNYRDILKTFETVNIKIQEFEIFINTGMAKFNSIEKDLLKKEEKFNLVTKQIVEFQNNFPTLTSNYLRIIFDNFCLNCGCLIGGKSKLGYKQNDSGLILCIKCNISCSVCKKLVTSNNESSGCFSCNKKVCSNCRKENPKFKIKFPECSFCKNNDYCIKCLNFNGVKHCCKNCLLKLDHDNSQQYKFMTIIQGQSKEWNFVDLDLSKEEIHNIFFLLENTSQVSSITFLKSSLQISEQYFKDFLYSIRNHKTLKTCTLELSDSIDPRTILKLIERKLHEIIFLNGLSISVFNYPDFNILDSFRNSFAFQWSPLKIYFDIEFHLNDAKKPSMIWKSFDYNLMLINKKQKRKMNIN